MKLLVATRNQGKLAELRALCASFPELAGLTLVSARDVAIPEVEEDGETFTANASKKALAGAKASGLPTLADDSGLEVEALEGLPGVYSARFAALDLPGAPRGNTPDEANMDKLLRLLEDVPFEKRGARFRCVMALALPSGEVTITEGTIAGVIAHTPRGSEGFGYDPVFLVPEYGCTFAELSPAVKNRISHRARAFAAMVVHLQALGEE